MNTDVLLISQLSGQCANVLDASTAPYASIVQRPCTGATNETWSLQPQGVGYRIVVKHSGQCLEVADASLVDGTVVLQSPCQGELNQTWILRRVGDWYQIVAAHSDECLNVDSGSRNTGAILLQWPCGDPDEKWTVSTQPLRSTWSSKIKFPLVPVSAANLSSGKILLWSADTRTSFSGEGGPARTYTVVFDPATGRSTEVLVKNTGHQMFCVGTTLLADGRLLANGGSTNDKTSIYSSATGTWSPSTAMNIPRGYQGNTLLSNGDVLTLGGSWSGGFGGKSGEVWRDGVGWRLLSNVPATPFTGPDPAGLYRGDNHLWLAAARDGWVFHAGPTAAMHWIDTNGFGDVVPAGNRGDDDFAINGNAVLYDVGRILTLGGAPAYDGRGASDSARIVDIRGGPGTNASVRRLGSMAFPRALHNSVVLPTGDVVVVGGQNVSQPFSDERSVYFAELWNSRTENFTRLSAMRTPRNYHSVALLMTDGRVFVAGGGLCGNCTTNHKDGEILTPPYLLNANGTAAARATINAAPSEATAGQTITVTTSSSVESFVLMRMAAATHSVNNDQRRVPLTIMSSSGLTYALAVPADRGTVLSGNYMLFAINGAGVPSVAKVLRLS